MSAWTVAAVRPLRPTWPRSSAPRPGGASCGGRCGAASPATGRYWVEAFRLEDLSAADIRGRLRIEGREHIDTALAGGRGAIFASPHLGNWDTGGAWLAAVGYPATAVVERLRPAELYERFAVYRRALGLELLPLDDGTETLRGVVRALRAGRLACLVCDRDLTGGGLEVGLFGARAVMPGGPASIALRTGAPLLPCSVYHDRRPGHWRAVVHPPLHPERSGDSRKDTPGPDPAAGRRVRGPDRRRPRAVALAQPIFQKLRMNIGLVCPYEWTVPGGVGNHVRALAAELRRAGHRVDVLAPAERPVTEPGFVGLGGSR